MNTLDRNFQTFPLHKANLLRFAAIAGLLLIGLSPWRVMAPVILLLLQILLDLGQICVTLLRVYGL
jgi:hypothetical protein